MMMEYSPLQISEEMGLSRREHTLINSSYRVATRQGCHRTTLQDIAEDAGVSKGLLLYHFRSKDRMLSATMRWALVHKTRRIRGSVATAERDPRAVIQALVDAIFVDPKQNREFYMLYVDMIEYGVRDPRWFKPLFGTIYEVTTSAYVEVLQDAVKSDVLAIADIDEAAIMMRSYIDGIFVIWLQEHNWRCSYESYRIKCFNGLMQLLVSHDA